MGKDNNSFLKLQIEALAIHYFTIVFNELETELKSFFINNIPSIPPEKREILYFALAGIKSNKIIYEVDNNSLSLSSLKYSSEETFSIFTTIQIVKLQRKHCLFTDLDFNIPSLICKNTEYPFTDCFIKLVNMRNKIAHERSYLTFKDSDFIEVLSNDYLNVNSAKWFDTLDTKVMSDESKSIFSNFLIMNTMLSELRKRACQNDEKMDS